MDKSVLQTTCLLLIFLAGIAAVGCSGPHVYIHPNPGLDRIKRMAVMPLENFSQDSRAGDKVRNGFVIELLRTGSFNVIDTGETDRIMQAYGLSYSADQSRVTAVLPGAEETADSTPLSKKIGETLKVEAILAGSVVTYSAERSGDQVVPEVGISARIIDAETGIIIWAGSHTRRGGMGIPILGWGKMTSLSTLSQQVIQDMARSLARYVPE